MVLYYEYRGITMVHAQNPVVLYTSTPNFVVKLPENLLCEAWARMIKLILLIRPYNITDVLFYSLLLTFLIF